MTCITFCSSAHAHLASLRLRPSFQGHPKIQRWKDGCQCWLGEQQRGQEGGGIKHTLAMKGLDLQHGTVATVEQISCLAPVGA